VPDDELTIRPHDSTIRPVRAEAPANFLLLERWFHYLVSEQSPLLPVALK